MNFYHFSREIFPNAKRDLVRHEKIVQICLAILVLIFTFYIYRKQLFLTAHWDVGWIKHVIWKNPLQAMPSDCCALDGQNSSYIVWSWHSIPLFSVFSLLSYTWPFGQVTWLLFFLSLPYAIIVFCVVYFGLASQESASNFRNACKVAIFSSIIGLSIGTFRSVHFPHYEVYFCSFALLLLYSLHKVNVFLTITAVLLCISVKEDSSFYLAIIYLCYFWGVHSSKRLLKNSLILILPSLLYMMILEMIDFEDPPNPNHPNETALQSQYLGTPAFKHLNLDFVSDRVWLHFADNWILYAVVIIIGIFSFSIKLSFGIRFVISILPHTLVALLGISPVKGGWAVYHQIPVWTTVLFAIIYFHVNFGFLNRLKYLISLVSLCLLSFASASLIYVYSGITSSIDIREVEKNYEHVIDLAMETGDVLDTNFFFLNPKRVPIDSWLREYNLFQSGQCLIHVKNSKSVDILSKLTSDVIPTQVDLLKPFVRTCFSR